MKTTDEKITEILHFFKEAFCVDGETKIADGKFEINGVVELNDSKRGKFFIATVNKVAFK